MLLIFIESPFGKLPAFGGTGRVTAGALVMLSLPTGQAGLPKHDDILLLIQHQRHHQHQQIFIFILVGRFDQTGLGRRR